MKKTLALVLTLALSTIFLAGCLSPLPDGFDSEAIAEASDAAVRHFNAKEFDELIAMFEPELQELISADMFAEQFSTVLDKKGPFTRFESVNMMGHTEETTGEVLAYVQAVAIYETGNLAHSMYFNATNELVSYQLGVEEGDLPPSSTSAATTSLQTGSPG